VAQLRFGDDFGGALFAGDIAESLKKIIFFYIFVSKHQ